MVRIPRNAAFAASIALGVALSALPATAQSPQSPAGSSFSRCSACICRCQPPC